MSKFGQTLFTASPFIRWTLSPFLILTMLVLPVTVGTPTSQSNIFMAGMELLGLFLLIGLWTKGRIQKISFRVLAGLVGAAYLAYLVFEFWYSEKPFRLGGSQAGDSPKNALLGFLVLGVPCLWFAVSGRFPYGARNNRLEASGG